MRPHLDIRKGTLVYWSNSVRSYLQMVSRMPRQISSTKAKSYVCLRMKSVNHGIGGLMMRDDGEYFQERSGVLVEVPPLQKPCRRVLKRFFGEQKRGWRSCE